MSNNEILTEIRERLVRVETKLDSMTDARDIATSAHTSAKSAHRRLDRIEKIVYWAGTTIIGAVVIGIINFFMR